MIQFDEDVYVDVETGFLDHSGSPITEMDNADVRQSLTLP